MRDLRIVFMGTPDFAVGILKALVENNYTIAGVITAPDKPAGRGMKMHESAVKKYAVENGLPVLQPTNLKNEDFLQELKALNANLQIVVAFRMLPKVVWQMPEFGTFNLHASLLPEYRGAAPINWAIINGETKTGVTTFFIDDNIDTGEMILQEEIFISDTDTAGTLHDKLMNLGASVVVKTVENIRLNRVGTSIQPQNAHLKTAYKIHRDTCKIDWSKDGAGIHNLIRGLSPYPAAWCTLVNGETHLDVKIYGSHFEKASHSADIGTLISGKDFIKIAVSDGYIFLDELQLPGKRKMSTKDILNGFRFHNEAHVL